MIQINIDLTYLYSITGGDKDFEKLLLSGTLVEIDQQITDLHLCWSIDDIAAVRLIAHSLISLSAIAGMQQVENWCREIELAFKNNLPRSHFDVLINNIISVWPAAKNQLEQVLVFDVEPAPSL